MPAELRFSEFDVFTGSVSPLYDKYVGGEDGVSAGRGAVKRAGTHFVENRGKSFPPDASENGFPKRNIPSPKRNIWIPSVTFGSQA